MDAEAGDGQRLGEALAQAGRFGLERSGLGPIGTLRAALHPELEAWLVVVPARISATRPTSRQMNA